VTEATAVESAGGYWPILASKDLAAVDVPSDRKDGNDAAATTAAVAVASVVDEYYDEDDDEERSECSD